MKHYFKSLDGLRGFGIGFVLFFHYFSSRSHLYVGFAWVFVQMFFVQSGYLITNILLADKDRGIMDYLKRFYWRRSLRIFPLYFLYLFIFLALYLAFHKPEGFPQRAPLLFTYTYNYARLFHVPLENDNFFGHLWSLAVEEQFYLIWPFVIYSFSVRNLQRILILIICLAPLTRLFVAQYLTSHGIEDRNVGLTIYRLTFSQFDAFAFGAAIPLFRLTEKINQTRFWALIAVGATLLIGMVNYYLLTTNGIDLHITTLGLPPAMIANYQHVWSYTLVDLMFMMVVIFLLTNGDKGVFNNPVLVSPGKIVYGIYVLHLPVMHMIKIFDNRYFGHPLISFTIACLLSWLLGYLSYRYYETRFLNLKDYGDKQKRGAKPVVTSEPA